MPSLLNMGTLVYTMPMWRFASPYDGYTSNWRAVCGKSARTVRREGCRENAASLPLSSERMDGLPVLDHGADDAVAQVLGRVRQRVATGDREIAGHRKYRLARNTRAFHADLTRLGGPKRH